MSKNKTGKALKVDVFEKLEKILTLKANMPEKAIIDYNNSPDNIYLEDRDVADSSLERLIGEVVLSDSSQRSVDADKILEEAGKETEKEAGKETEKEAGKETEKEAGKETEKEAGKETEEEEEEMEAEEAEEEEEMEEEEDEIEVNLPEAKIVEINTSINKIVAFWRVMALSK